MRYFSYIVNLCAQAFIIGSDTDRVLKEIDRAIQEMDFKKVRQLWKKQGAIGLFQNLIRYIRASPQRRQMFKGIKVGDRYDGLEVSTLRLLLVSANGNLASTTEPDSLELSFCRSYTCSQPP